MSFKNRKNALQSLFEKLMFQNALNVAKAFRDT